MTSCRADLQLLINKNNKNKVDKLRIIYQFIIKTETLLSYSVHLFRKEEIFIILLHEVLP